MKKSGNFVKIIIKFRLPDPWKKVLLGFQPLGDIGISIS